MIATVFDEGFQAPESIHSCLSFTKPLAYQTSVGQHWKMLVMPFFTT